MRLPFSHCLAHQPLTALLADTHHFIQEGLDWKMLAIMIIHENHHLMIIHFWFGHNVARIIVLQLEESALKWRHLL